MFVVHFLLKKFNTYQMIPLYRNAYIKTLILLVCILEQNIQNVVNFMILRQKVYMVHITGIPLFV